ncbi:TadE/TadG family type IV pilus assembly protein [Paraburkholderia elongata]|uniref:Pilus assembly protein n=1 Tax=Paraburkholderia elongata TaxID=2675747 RepID=A0A972NY58_9BURK|nr:TadE/TadG family type IV pilus assembly protein [Paraburkholderia elongata]NPT60544.1 pilus assembly protein [Paraburkholderia elongata]
MRWVTPRANRRATSWRGDERGVVALEFVLVFPFLMLVLFGIIDTSLILCDKAVITNASREAARAGVVVRVPQMAASQISTVALTYAQGSLVTGGTATTPTVTVDQSSGTASGSPLKVTVSYAYQGLVLGSALSALTGPVTLTAVTVMNYE